MRMVGQQGQSTLARSSPCGHPPLPRPTRWLRANPCAREEHPRRVEAKRRLWRRQRCLPKVADVAGLDIQAVLVGRLHHAAALDAVAPLSEARLRLLPELGARLRDERFALAMVRRGVLSGLRRWLQAAAEETPPRRATAAGAAGAAGAIGLGGAAGGPCRFYLSVMGLLRLVAPHVQPGHLRQSRGLGRLLLGLGRSVLQPPRLRSAAATVLELLMQPTLADPRPPVPPAAAAATAAAVFAAAVRVPATTAPAAVPAATAALPTAAAALAPASVKPAFKISKISRAPVAVPADAAASTASAPSAAVAPMSPPPLPARLVPLAFASAAPPAAHPLDPARRDGLAPEGEAQAQAARGREAKREAARGEAGPERQEGKRRRVDAVDAAEARELLARLVKPLLLPAYRAKEISREGFKLAARAVTCRAREMAAAGQLPQSEEAITTVLASLVEDELTRPLGPFSVSRK